MAEGPASGSHSQSPSSTAALLGRHVIPIVNKLQDIFAQLGSQSTIELPQVAVVGSQSSGKSSVLEALVGRDFLPRVPTFARAVLWCSSSSRLSARPMVQMRSTGSSFTCLESSSTISLRSEGKFRQKPIGKQEVPVGDQPSDIEARIRTMIMSYIKVPRCLILAVSPANADLANSDALQMAGMADPDGHRTIGIITKDIMFNRSIKDALEAEEKFFRSRSVYNGLADQCGVPQLAKKLNQCSILRRPGLKSHISSALVSVAKEHATYGEITESKAGQGTLLLNILSKYSKAFSSMVEGKNEEMSTIELSGGARIHYIFQSIFVKSLEEVDPCEDLADEDIRTAIQNATGPKSALFVPEVPFEALVQRQIARLLDPSLQCARFIYDELMKISHRCMVNELQRFPVLRKRIDEVLGNFLREGLEPSEIMIRHLIEMEMNYINTSHPNFIGGSKAVEIAQQQAKITKMPLPNSRQKDGVELDKAPASERTGKSRAILARPVNGIIPDQPVGTVVDNEKGAFTGNASGSSWGISSIFGGSDSRTSAKEFSTSKPHNEPVHTMELPSMIQLREPPTVLRPSENHSEEETVELAVTKLLLRSYYDIVRKNIEDSIPKVNHTKRELHNVFIQKLYRENLFEEMLQEPDEVAVKRKRTRETLRVLQQAFRTLDELPLEAETVEKGYNFDSDSTGLLRIHGLPLSSLFSSISS
ncbi:hypothetical protein SAY86_017339 [Trapa natans]|uniref:GED domain-containing protein n=1 Tax=Trapa natans TaxID=22666 RepID=A0AAN7LPV3_TRANT|nr:hypothetical protein SAY86_017339 [Trapa natans]